METIATPASQVQSFGPGGQRYAANLTGGVILITGSKQQAFFDIAESAPGIWNKALTNLKEAGKIGNSMTFEAMQYGIRFVKLDGTVATAAELAALAAYVASCRVELFIGSNSTKIFEMDGAHLQNVINGASIDANSVLAPVNNSAWVSLPAGLGLVQGLAPNTEISGLLSCFIPTGTPAAISSADPAAPKWAFKFVMAGIKQTKT